jgi:GTP-binding protein EngB required for normal cell division
MTSDGPRIRNRSNSFIMNEIDFSESRTSLKKVVKVKSRNILVVGLTGSGKSSIIGSICGVEGIASLRLRSVTSNITLYQDNKITDPDNGDEYVINLFDTVGLGDQNVDVPKILKQIIEIMPTELSKIHKIVFCFKMDRLRAFMAQELNSVYNFFKLVGAKIENFVICLTFCDILNNKTIGDFWNEMKETADLEMAKEIRQVTFVSFPNLHECDQVDSLLEYLKGKIENSKVRIFNSVVKGEIEPFYPHSIMTRMPEEDFTKIVGVLRSYRTRKHWFWSMFEDKDQEEMLKLVSKTREQDKKTDTKKK